MDSKNGFQERIPRMDSKNGFQESIERKYYPFFQKYGHNINLIPYTGIKTSDFFDELKQEWEKRIVVGWP